MRKYEEEIIGTNWYVILVGILLVIGILIYSSYQNKNKEELLNTSMEELVYFLDQKNRITQNGKKYQYGKKYQCRICRNLHKCLPKIYLKQERYQFLMPMIKKHMEVY